MKKEKIIIGSRGSKLALIYAKKVKEKILEKSELKEHQITIKGIVTKGDQLKDKRLSESGGKGLFPFLSTVCDKYMYQSHPLAVFFTALKFSA